MSTVIMALCWPVEMPPVRKAVLISLADQANDAGVCWPRLADICIRTCYSERAVQTALRDLQQQGILDVEIGAAKANRYTIRRDAIAALQGVQRPPPDKPTPQDVHPAPPAPRRTCTPQDVHPAPPAGSDASAPMDARARAPRGEYSNTQNTNTPPIPPVQGRGAEGQESEAEATPLRKLGMITLRRYLEECAKRGVKPVPAGDPVFAYCEQVGISREILALHWREFKTRRLATDKRQADWPKTFLNSVKGNWYRLWYMRPGEPATLSTQGLQAQAEMVAEQQARQEAAS